MENTKENKERFFAQYCNQKVLNTGSDITFLNKSWNWGHPNFFLELKPLSQITDEDAIEVCKIWYPKNGKENWSSSMWGKEYCEDIFNQLFIECEIDFGGSIDLGDKIIYIIDFLRSKGYLIPYNGLSTETLIAYGWAKTY